MSLNLLKSIGLGILGLGGASSVAALSSSRVRKFIGISSVVSQSSPSTPSSTPDTDSSSLGEGDRQGQFLYKLSKQLFNALKQDSKSDLTQNPKENVVKGLKDKFNGSLANEDDKWENFKSLCDEQQKKETKSGKDVDNIYSRLCFLDNPNIRESAKGYIWHGYTVSPFFSADNNRHFLNISKDNFEMGDSFNKKYPNGSPLDKFDEGYSLSEEEPTQFRLVMQNIIAE